MALPLICGFCFIPINLTVNPLLKEINSGETTCFTLNNSSLSVELSLSILEPNCNFLTSIFLSVL